MSGCYLLWALKWLEGFRPSFFLCAMVKALEMWGSKAIKEPGRQVFAQGFCGPFAQFAGQQGLRGEPKPRGARASVAPKWVWQG